jgi:LysM repeat protein
MSKLLITPQTGLTIALAITLTVNVFFMQNSPQVPAIIEISVYNDAPQRTPSAALIPSITPDEPLITSLTALKRYSLVSAKSFNRQPSDIPTSDELMIIGSPYGIPGTLIQATMFKESHGRFNAVSHKGAKSAFQFLDDTAAEFGVAQLLHDNFAMADAASRYMAYLHMTMYGKSIGESDNNSLAHTLAAYNAGLGRVNGTGKPRIPRFEETLEYIDDIMGYHLGKKHYIARGETLRVIANQYNISVAQLRRANAFTIMSNQDLKYGKFISIDHTIEHYVVKKGDTLSKIARLSNVLLADIVLLNKINPRKYLAIGQHLLLKAPIYQTPPQET